MNIWWLNLFCLSLYESITNKIEIMSIHYNLPIGKDINTFPATQGNAITKEYYNFLVGEINRGTMIKAVCRIENKRFNTESYHLISVK